MSKYLEFEKNLVACSIMDKDAAVEFLGSFDPEDLGYIIHTRIMTAIKSLLEKDIHIDTISIKEEAEGITSLDLMDMDFLPTAANHSYYLESYIEYSRKYKLQSTLGDIDNSSAEEVYDSICKIMNQKSVIKSKTLDQIVENTGKEMAKDTINISTGFKSLDGITTGIGGSSLVIVAATPKTGKSTFALNMAYNMAVEGKKVLYFSFEMSEEENAQKIVSMCSLNYSGEKMKYDTNRHRVQKNLPLKFITASSLDVMQIKAEIQRDAPDIVYIDQLDCIPTPKKERYDIAVGEVVVGLKKICVDQKIPIFLLHQLGRAAMKDSGSPELYHLKNSQIVEQKADIVMLLKRDKDAEDSGNFEDIQVHVKANRMGGEGFVTLKMNPRVSAFRESEYVSPTYVNKNQLPF